MPDPLTAAERAESLPPLAATGWRAAPDRDAIRKILKFRNFSEAWGFMSRAALAAEQLDHHPEWANVYNRVDITLTTHSCGGLSELDLVFARRLDKLAGAADVLGEDLPPIDRLLEPPG